MILVELCRCRNFSKTCQMYIVVLIVATEWTMVWLYEICIHVMRIIASYLKKNTITYIYIIMLSVKEDECTILDE